MLSFSISANFLFLNPPTNVWNLPLLPIVKCSYESNKLEIMLDFLNRLMNVGLASTTILLFITTFFSFCWILSLTNFLNSFLRSVFTILLRPLTTYRHFTNMFYRGSFLFLYLEYTWIYRAFHLQTLRCLPLEVLLCAGLVQPLFLRLVCTKWLSMFQSYLFIPSENLWHKLMIWLLNWRQVYSCLNLQHSKHVLVWLSDHSQFLCCHPLWTHSPSLWITNKIMILSDLLYSFAVDFSDELFVILSESRQNIVA